MSATKTYYTTTPRTPVAQTCVTAVPGKNGHVPIDIGACNVYWAYDPSFSAAVAFAVLFGITTVRSSRSSHTAPQALLLGHRHGLSLGI